MSAIGLHRLGLIVAALVLQTALLRAALPGPDEAQARPSLVGQLLVAAPEMGDPRFERTVILIVEHGPDGAKGLENVSRFPHLSAELVRPGFYERDIAKTTSGNMLCVLRRLEAIGGQLRKAPDTGQR